MARKERRRKVQQTTITFESSEDTISSLTDLEKVSVDSAKEATTLGDEWIKVSVIKRLSAFSGTKHCSIFCQKRRLLLPEKNF